RRPADLQALADAALLRQWQAAVAAVFLSPELQEMLLALAQRSREDARVRTGLSPRGLLALKASAQAWAFLAGRDFVTPDDLRAVTVPVLGHRLLSSASLGGDELTALLMQDTWGFGP
ncbi:AAA family ATPase, partial [Acidithiobacillus ferriphilus]|nr:AAA family ATPase [Acidithiobacillus ferriphilus]